MNVSRFFPIAASTFTFFLSPDQVGAASDLVEITVSNPSGFARTDEIVKIPLSELSLPGNVDLFRLEVIPEGANKFEAASQIVDEDADGTPDTLIFLHDFAAGESANFTLSLREGDDVPRYFAKRAQAEIAVKEDGTWQGHSYIGGRWKNVRSLAVPKEHDIHSWFLRYEGPGLESDKIAYRFYLDRRNGYDIFGKHTDSMVLQNINLDNREAYHIDSDWGMDILKVGNSLGAGATGWWNGEKAVTISDERGMRARILDNGILLASVETVYENCTIGGQSGDLTVRLSIEAGSRLVCVVGNYPPTLGPVCAGIGKMQGKPTSLLEGVSGQGPTAWGYCATWGEQAADGKMLGKALFYRIADVGKVTKDVENFLVVFRNAGTFEYCFGAAWEGEKNGITTKKEFRAWCENVCARFTAPLKISAKPIDNQRR